jgi:hypothetical protein
MTRSDSSPDRETAFGPEPTHQHHDPQVVFQFICEYKRANDGNSPSLREIMAACGVSSSSLAANILNRLERQGLIVQSKIFKGSRSLCVVGGRWTYVPKESRT